METLKRDWDGKLTLRDILVVIGCLLIQPNPDSALNAEAGSLLQEDYAAFSRRASMLTSIHAVVPRGLKEVVVEAQNRGQVLAELEAVEEKVEVKDLGDEPVAPVRRRKLGATARQRGTTASRRSEGSPSGAPARRRPQAGPSQPFVLQTANDDVFGDVMKSAAQREPTKYVSDDDSMADADQENDEVRSPAKAPTPKAATPRRPQGQPVPLGELTIDETSSDGESEMEEYPPSPRKSPSKSPRKQRPQLSNIAESSRDALRRAPNITPPTNMFSKPLAEGSPFGISADPTPSPRKARLQRPVTPVKPATQPGGLFGFRTPKSGGGILKPISPSESEKKRQARERKAQLDAKLWKLCGGDIKRWNQGDFDGQPFKKMAARW